MASSSAIASALSPVWIDCSPRSADSTGQRWPVPWPLGAHGCPSIAPSP